MFWNSGLASTFLNRLQNGFKFFEPRNRRNTRNLVEHLFPSPRIPRILLYFSIGSGLNRFGFHSAFGSSAFGFSYPALP